MAIVINLLLGISVGAYGTLVGAGGGFLLVPLFLLLYGMPHEVAVGTSLLIVVGNAFSGALTFVLQKRVDYRAGVVFGLATLPGAFAGAYLTTQVSGPLFLRLFGAFLLLVALYLLFRRPPGTKGKISGERGWGWVNRRTAGESYEYFEPLGAGLSVLVGIFSSWFGIGGGILHVPAMTEILRFPVHVAVATSQFVLFWTAIMGAGVHGSKGHFDLELVLSVGAGAIIGAQIGARLSKKLAGGMVIRLLAIAVLAVGLRMIFSA